jgi:predicted flavoprotein YhiN
VAVRSLEHSDPAQIRVRWTARDEREWERALRPRGTQTVQAVVAAVLPPRLAEALIRHAKVDRRSRSQLQRAERRRLIDTLVRGTLPWEGHEGYKKAEVTGGGVSLSDIDPKTMESRTQRGLYLCGEMLDAFGPIGGYNFLWAWATGRAAGVAAAMD